MTNSPVVFRDLRVKHDLHQQVAQLLGDAVRLAVVQRIERLVRLFEQEALQRLVRLLEVPRTAALRRAQLRDDRAHALKRPNVGR